MKNTLKKFSLLAFWLLYLLLISCFSCFSQQNLFNVPSSDITEEGKLFIQHQLNISGRTQHAITFDVGLGKGFEIGCNIFDLMLNTPRKHQEVLYHSNNPSSPIVSLNMQKGMHLSENAKIGIGVQSGFGQSVSLSHAAEFFFANYSNNFPAIHLCLNAGAYYGNKAYVGRGNNLGMMAGAEYKMLDKKFHLLADVYTGNNTIAVSVIGFTWFMRSNLALSGGYQIPFFKSGNANAIVIELTKS
jgi:hypothetical protein